MIDVQVLIIDIAHQLFPAVLSRKQFRFIILKSY